MISESAWSKCLSLTSLWQQTSLGISTRPPLTHSQTTLIHSTEFPPSGEVGIKEACKHTDKSHECILLVHANPPCSCCFLSYLCVFSSLCHALFLCAQSTVYLKPYFNGEGDMWSFFFPVCSSWINTLTSSMWVCRNANLYWLRLFCSSNCVLCQHGELLWGEYKSRNCSLHCSGICKYLYSPPLDSWVRLHQSPGEDGWSKETLRSPSHWILWAIFLNMNANQTEICSGQSSKLAGQSKPNHPKHIYFCIHLPQDGIFWAMCVSK